MKDIEFDTFYRNATIDWLSEDENIHYIVKINYGFKYDEYNCQCEINYMDCSQIYNGVEHPYFLKMDELIEVKQMVANVVNDDVYLYGFQDVLDADKDFYTQNDDLWKNQSSRKLRPQKTNLFRQPFH